MLTALTALSTSIFACLHTSQCEPSSTFMHSNMKYPVQKNATWNAAKQSECRYLSESHFLAVRAKVRPHTFYCAGKSTLCRWSNMAEHCLAPFFLERKKNWQKPWRVTRFILTRFQASALSSWTRFQNKAVPLCFATKRVSLLSSQIMADFPFSVWDLSIKPF